MSLQRRGWPTTCPVVDAQQTLPRRDRTDGLRSYSRSPDCLLRLGKAWAPQAPKKLSAARIGRRGGGQRHRERQAAHPFHHERHRPPIGVAEVVRNAELTHRYGKLFDYQDLSPPTPPTAARSISPCLPPSDLGPCRLLHGRASRPLRAAGERSRTESVQEQARSEITLGTARRRRAVDGQLTICERPGDCRVPPAAGGASPLPWPATW